MYILHPLSDWGVWHRTPLEVIYNNHSPAPIYGWYLPGTSVYCGACCTPGADSVSYVFLHVCVLWCLERTWCCQCLLHLTYVLAICVFCGACNAPGAVTACCTWHICWIYVCILVLGMYLVLIMCWQYV